MKKEVKSLIAQISFIIVFLAVWQIIYALDIWPDILFPSLATVGKALVTAFAGKGFGGMVLHSLFLLLKGLLLGIVVAMICSSLSIMNDTVAAIYNLIVAMFDLIPGIALIPIAILWLGIGVRAKAFIIFFAPEHHRRIQDGTETLSGGWGKYRAFQGKTGVRCVSAGGAPTYFLRNQNRLGESLARSDQRRDGVWRRNGTRNRLFYHR